MRKISVKELQIIGSIVILVLMGFVALSGYSGSNTMAIGENSDKPKSVSFPIDLNSCSEKELELLPGIGPAKARAIVDYRATSGPFFFIDDLLLVRGIGEKTLSNLREMVTVSGQLYSNAEGVVLIDINTASSQSLQKIPGIGEAKAAAIIEYRELKGPIITEEDLLNVPGIGPSILPEILAAIIPLIGAEEQSGSRKVNVNNADVEDLCKLPGIGPVLAQRIVEARAHFGPFRSCDDLAKVSGIGDKTIASLKELVEF